MFEMAQRVNWDEYILILSQGSPTIGVQLLVVNGLLIAYWLYQRARKRKVQHNPGWLLSALFVAGNVGVVTWGSRLAF